MIYIIGKHTINIILKEINMATIKRTLPLQNISKELSLSIPDSGKINCVTKNDPALKVMTDLNQVTAFQIDCSSSIDEANDKMIACGVRLLFVKELNGKLAGIITANDILGEKPLLTVSQNNISRANVNVRHIMTPVSKLTGLPMEHINTSRVSDIITAFKWSRRHHMLVLENLDSSSAGSAVVRGIFSITQLSRQLGEDIIPDEHATSFAQLHVALA